MCQAIRPTGSPSWSPPAAPTRRSARIRSTSSSGSRPPSTTSAAKAGTPPAGLHAGRNPRASGDALKIARARYALWKNPDTLTAHQHAQLEWIAKTDPRLHRAYLLKEGLRLVFALGGDAGKEALDRWLSWARRCQIP
jgi:hypothetical protein